jgi:hypothetical protein
VLDRQKPWWSAAVAFAWSYKAEGSVNFFGDSFLRVDGAGSPIESVRAYLVHPTESGLKLKVIPRVKLERFVDSGNHISAVAMPLDSNHRARHSWLATDFLAICLS